MANMGVSHRPSRIYGPLACRNSGPGELPSSRAVLRSGITRSKIMSRRNIDIIDIRTFERVAKGMRQPFRKKYLAMYSSVFGGIVTDPALMLVPIDDHMVHRGDGIFEAFKAVNGNIYNLKGHLERLERSTSAISLELPLSLDDITDIVLETVRTGQDKDCYVRIYVSRGCGGFSVSPFECPEPHLYVMVTKGVRPFMERHPEGARVGASAIPVKPPPFATIKSCNYLPNVLMKLESELAGLDFMVAFDPHGFVAECATENFGIVTQDHALLFPRLSGILRGTTMVRVVELAQALLETGELTSVSFTDITKDEIFTAAELLIVGTTPNVTMVCEFDGKIVNEGKPGPIFSRLSALLDQDMASNSDLLTPTGL